MLNGRWSMFLVTCVTTIAHAASTDAEYLKVRNAARAEIVKVGGSGFEKAWAKWKVELEGHLRALVGDVSVPGLPSKGEISMEVLTESEAQIYALDALTFFTKDERPVLVATTEGLLTRWIADNFSEEGKPTRTPTLEAVLHGDQFASIFSPEGVAYTRAAAVPIEKPSSVDFAAAQIGCMRQDAGPCSPEALIVGVSKAGRVLLATATAKARIKVAACNEIWKQSEKKAAAFQKQARAKDDDSTLFEKATREENSGDAAFFSCFQENAPKADAFPALVKEAQALANRLAGE